MKYGKGKFLSNNRLECNSLHFWDLHPAIYQYGLITLKLGWRFIQTSLAKLRIKVFAILRDIDLAYEAEGVSRRNRQVIYMMVTSYLAFSPGLMNLVLIYTNGIYLPFTPTIEALGAYFMGIYMIRWARTVRFSLTQVGQHFPFMSWLCGIRFESTSTISSQKP